MWNMFGECFMKARVSEIVDEKTVHAQHGWWFPEEDGSEPNLYGNFRCNINNLLPNGHMGKLGFGAPNKCLICNIEPVSESYDTDMDRRLGKIRKAGVNMATYGLLIDYEYCTNCGSCQVSCKEEHGYPVGKTGIAVHADGPWAIDGDNWNFNYFPLPTDLCDLCADRTERGREPICVHHCLANVMYYGEVEELAKRLADKPKQLLIVPQYLPREARGEFVHVDKGNAHQAAHVEVKATGVAAFGAHRHDAKVGEIDESDVIEDIL